MNTPQSRPISGLRLALRKRPACILGLLVYVTLCGPLAHASMVYAYEGSNFQTASGIYSTADYISGTFFTSDPLAPNLSSYSITPAGYSFSDGIFDWTSSDSTISSFEVTTDGYGTLTGAIIQLVTKSGYPWSFDNIFVGTLVINDSGTSVSVMPPLTGGTGQYGSASAATSGKWGPDFDPPDGVPEPATWFLTLPALLAATFRARTRIARGIRDATQMHR